MEGVLDVSGWEVVRYETIGRNPKIWLREPGVSDRGREHDWLFKPVVVPANGKRQGEDWAEKLACALGRALGVPCADVELAVRHGVEGSISRNVAPEGRSLVLGTVLLSAENAMYRGGEDAPRGRPGHSLVAIRSALRWCASPGIGELDAFGVFAGYLVFDAWIANQDRHDQNWAVLRRSIPPGDTALAPSFDHASGLGFNLDDVARQKVLDGGVSRWARRGRAHRFEHDPEAPPSARPTLVELAHLALALAGPPVAEFWSERLSTLSEEEVRPIIARTPRMSDVAATFVVELLETNRGRLLS